MKIEDLQKYFEMAESNRIRFEGSCHDCGIDVCIDIDIDEEGKIVVTGGAVYHPQIGRLKDTSTFFVKCDKCYENDERLRNFQPCDVYSRIVGYLRPVRQWNVGKQAEFKKRKVFNLE